MNGCTDGEGNGKKRGMEQRQYEQGRGARVCCVSPSTIGKFDKFGKGGKTQEMQEKRKRK
jgi:hypothetical protein